MGTALTDEQVGLLARLAPTVVLALDADGAGQEAMLKAARLAAKQSFELRVVPLPAGSDPADVLQREGAEAVPALVGRAVAFVRFQVERIIAAGDVTTAEGRDRILGELAPVFGEIGVGAMREELEREVAGRVGISEKLVERLLAPSAARAAGGPVGAGQRPAAVAGGALDASARTERAFLELCIALPDLGETMLAEADLDALFASPSARAAAAHLRGHLRSPSAGVEDGDLAALLAELSVRAAAQGSVSAQLELMRRQLELDRIERAIAAARAGGEGGLTALMIEREGVKRELDEWLTRSLEKTGAGVR
jgi:DNA primase